MVPGPRLVGERLSRYRALGVQGEPAWRYAGQLRAALIGRLGQEHADFLAIPQVVESGERIDWYAPFEGPVVQADQLAPPERAELDIRARRFQEDMEVLAQQLGQSGRTDAERNFSRLLRHALTVPGRAMLFSVAGRPVYAFWGFAQDPTANVAPLPAAAAATLPAMGAPPAPPPMAAPAVLSSSAAAIARPEGGYAWKLTLLALFLLALLALGAWVIKPYLPVLFGLEDYGRRAAAASPASEVADGTTQRQAALAKARETGTRLSREFTSLGGDLTRKQSSCAPGSIGAVIGPSGEIVAGDGRVVGAVVATPDGKVELVGTDGKPVMGADGKPLDARAAVEQAARDRTAAEKASVDKPEPGKAPGDKAAVDKPGADKPGTDKAAIEKAAAEKAAADKGAMPPRGPDGARRDGAKPQTAELPKTPAEPTKTPAEKAAQAKIEKPLTVPADARARRDVAFLQGDWRSRSTLTTQRGEEDIRINYEFDDKGKGKSMIVQQNGVTCEAPAVAKFDKDGKLVIEEQANPQCSDGTSYVKSVVTCDVGKEGGADCGGRNDGGKTYSVQIGK